MIMSTTETDLPVDEVITPESKNIKRYGYRAADKVLVVEFSNGATYETAGVEPETFAQLRNAESVGSFYQKEIRPNYKAEKLETK